MFKYVALVAFLAASTYAQTPVTECSNGLPLPELTDFNGCTEEPCPIPIGDHLAMNVTIIAPKTLETMHVEVIAYALGIETPYPLPESDVCQLLLNTVCPVEEGETVIFQAGMEILNIFPQIPVELSFSVLDEPEGEGIACFHVKAQVV